jgi:hypothetical protein
LVSNFEKTKKHTPMKKFFIAIVLVASTSAVFTACSNSEAKVAYQCPMKCEGENKTYDSAGKCPMCNMDMKEVKAVEK